MFEQPPRRDWQPLAVQLRGLLDEPAWRAARASTLNAHYTATWVASAMWDTVERLGFDGGRVLEPGCGSGNFLGLAPRHGDCELVGVEADPTTATVAGLLYPDAVIHPTPFEKTALGEASFELVVGNVPFANVTPHDPVGNRDGWSLHNYFIARSAALLRPGGLMAVITSRFTLDAVDPRFRTALAQRMDLLGAIRLPQTAFAVVAGTNAITDILILRRHDNDGAALSDPQPRWLNVSPLITTDGSNGDPPMVNDWFLTDPDRRVCGTLTVGRGQYRAGDLVVTAPKDPAGTLHTQLDHLVHAAHQQRRLAPTPQTTNPVGCAPDASTRDGRVGAAPVSDSVAASGRVEGRDVSSLPDGSIVALRDGTFARTVGTDLEAVKPPSTQRRELRELIGLRDTVMDLLDAETADAPEDDLDRQRAELNDAYDRYVAHHGPINRSVSTRTGRRDPATGEPSVTRRFPRMGGFRSDPGWAVVSALERYDDETGTATKANILTERVIRPRQPITRVDTPADAIAVSLDRTGHVDLAVIADVLGTDETDAQRRVADLVWLNPETRRYETTDDYLSGNVRRKLAAAEAAAVDDDSFRANVAALRDALPTDLGPAEIDAALGAPWIDPSDIEAFIRDVLGASDVSVTHDPVIAAWTVGVSSWQRKSVEMTSTWGTARRSGAELVEAALNQRPVTIYDTLADGARVVNETETMAARDKLDQLTDRFRTWVWEDPGRTDRLCGAYNERFNSIVLRRFDGNHLQLPGLADWFVPHPHQRDAVWRIVNQGDVLLAHVVGAGKTATMVMAASEMRRLGLVNKPCFVVPNHMLEQFTREFLQLYPKARVLAANFGGTTLEDRRRFVAQCATGDWDGVILTRESFRAIPVTTATEEAFLRQRLDALEAALEQARTERPTVKELEKALAREQARVEKLLNAPARDDSLCFEQTGVDYVFVDESHGYKGKRVWSRIPDVTATESQRATDLDMKLSWLRQRNPHRVATFATGTPIANAIAEMWVMQSFVQPGVLAEAGCEHFDAWAATFASTVTSLELKPSGGGYQQKTRFARYRNVPELLRLFHANADVRTAGDLDLPTPNVTDTEPIVAVPASPQLTAYVESLVVRAERVKQRAVQPTEDNMLKITGDGRKAALDLRLVRNADGVDQSPVGSHKIAACAERVAKIWADTVDRTYLDEHGQDSPNRGALQLVFCDIGTPKADGSWSAYGELRRQLVAHGIPAERVRFVHEARNDREKAELFQACRDGRVAVIVGSSEKMGVGTNIQNRAIALHHLDCPWRPAELEQREGRILRQGNQNADVEIIRYVTEASFDVFMWQTVSRKSMFLHQVMSGDPAAIAREIDDLGEQALTYSQVMAIATGNPLIMEKAAVEADLAKLRRLRSAHDAEQALLRRRVDGWTRDIDKLEHKLTNLLAAESRRQPTTGDQFTVAMPDGTTIAARADWGSWLRDAIIENTSPYATTGRTIDAGTLAGLTITIETTNHNGPGDPRVALIGIDTTGQDIPLDRASAIGADPVGLARRVEHLAERLPAAISDMTDLLERTRADLAAATTRIGTPFPKHQELDQLQRRVVDLESALTPTDQPLESPQPVLATSSADRLADLSRRPPARVGLG